MPDLTSGSEQQEPLAWVFGLTSLELANATINLDLPQASGPLKILDLKIENLKAWTPETPGSLSLNATFAGGSIVGSLDVRPFTDVLDIAYDLEVDNMALDAFDFGVPLSGALSVDLKGDIQSSQHVALNAAGNISLVNGAYTEGDHVIEFDNLDVAITRLAVRTEEGKLRDAISAGEQVTIEAQGEISAQNLSYEGAGQTAAIGALEVVIGAVDVVSLDGVVTYAAEASLVAEQVVVGTQATELARVGTVSLVGISAQKDGTFSAASFVIDTIAALQTEDGGTAIAHLSAGPLALDADGTMSFGDIAVAGAQASLHLTEEGIAEFAALDAQAVDAPAPDAEVEDAQVIGDGPAFKFSSLMLADEATVKITDQTLAQPQTFDLVVNTLEAQAVDSTAPDTPTDVVLAVSLGDQTKLTVAGWIKPLADEGPDFDLQGAIKSLALPQISDYAAKSVGVHLRAGRLDLTFNGQATQGQLDARTDWLIQHIELEELDDFDRANQIETANLPIEKAVNLLQDKDGNITLNIPISGALDDPAFDLSSVISKAIGNAVQGAVVATLKVLFPFALLADIADDKGGLTLEPVTFAPLSSAINEAAATYIGSVGDLMDDRPKISLLVCGVAARADLEALRLPAHQAALATAQAAVQAVAPVVEGAPRAPRSCSLACAGRGKSVGGGHDRAGNYRIGNTGQSAPRPCSTIAIGPVWN